MWSYNRRSRKFKNEQKKCARCGTIENLTVHHLLSKKKYPEIKHFKANWICLCRSCHDWVELDFEGYIWETDQFLEKKQKLLEFVNAYRYLRDNMLTL